MVKKSPNWYGTVPIQSYKQYSGYKIRGIRYRSFWASRIWIYYYLYGSGYFHQQAKNLKNHKKNFWWHLEKSHWRKEQDDQTLPNGKTTTTDMFLFINVANSISDNGIWIPIWIRIVACGYGSETKQVHTYILQQYKKTKFFIRSSCYEVMLFVLNIWKNIWETWWRRESQRLALRPRCRDGGTNFVAAAPPRPEDAAASQEYAIPE